MVSEISLNSSGLLFKDIEDMMDGSVVVVVLKVLGSIKAGLVFSFVCTSWCWSFSFLSVFIITSGSSSLGRYFKK